MSVMDLAMRNSQALGVVLTNRVVNPAVTLLQGATGYWDVANYTSGSQTLPNRGTGGTALDAQLGSTSSVDSNDPQYLPYSGTPYVYLPGSAGYMSAAHAADQQITDDLEIVLRVAADDWTPSGTQRMLSKDDNSAQRSYGCALNAAGTVSLFCKYATTGVATSTSTSALTVADATAYWLKFTRRKSDGRIQIFQAADQASEPSAWTQVGNNITVAAGEAIVTGTAEMAAGAFSGGSSPFAGKFYRVIVRNGIGGTTVLDVDTSVLTSGSATSFTAVTGQTVTINRSSSGRKAVAVVRPVMLFGTDDYLEVPDNDLLDFTGSEPLTEVVAYRAWGSTANQTISAKKADATTAAGYQFDTGTGGTAPRFVIADGTLSTTATGPTKTAGVGSIVAVVRDVAADTITVYTGATAGTPVTDTTTATLANSGVSRVGRLAGAGTAYLDAEFLFRGTFRRALSASEISLLATYAASRMP